MPPDAEATFDPVPMIELLADAGVDFVVIGGVAGSTHGSAFATSDLDVAYARNRRNLERIAKALRSVGATLRGAPDHLPFQVDAESLEEGGNFTFATRLGSLDILAYPAGAPPYERLKHDSVAIEVKGRTARVCSLDHLIAMKEATGRPRDRERASELRVISDHLRAPKEP